jgi:CCT motif
MAVALLTALRAAPPAHHHTPCYIKPAVAALPALAAAVSPASVAHSAYAPSDASTDEDEPPRRVTSTGTPSPSSVSSPALSSPPARRPTEPGNAQPQMSVEVAAASRLAAAPLVPAPHTPDTILYKYSVAERAAALRRFKEKKRLRTFKKTIRYDVRKRLADTRPRYKGRFSKPPPGALYDDGTSPVESHPVLLASGLASVFSPAHSSS